MMLQNGIETEEGTQIQRERSLDFGYRIRKSSDLITSDMRIDGVMELQANLIINQMIHIYVSQGHTDRLIGNVDLSTKIN